MKAIQIEAFGNPAEVLKVVDIPDVGAPAARPPDAGAFPASYLGRAGNNPRYL
jgi:hypothetical protein